MEKSKADTSLDDVLDELVYSSETMSASLVEEFVEKYPEYKREIADFVAAWLVTERVEDSDISAEEVSQEELLRLQSLTLNYLHQQRLSVARANDAEIKLVRAALDTYRGAAMIGRLTTDLGLASWTQLTAFILTGVIKPAPRYLMRRLSEILTVPADAVESALLVDGRRRLVHLSSKTKPKSQDRSLSWAEAVAQLPADDKEKKRLLALSELS